MNGRKITYSSIQDTMFNVMREVRRKDVTELAAILKAKADAFDNEAVDDYAPIDGILDFHLHQRNQTRVRNLLARLSAHLDAEAGGGMPFSAYIDRSRRDSYDIEHIWADKFERHEDEFDDEQSFSEYRDRLGGLLLLPRSFNRSYGALPYAEKRRHYNSQNLLARSLCDECYDHNPGFLTYRDRSGIDFRPHTEFRTADLDERQDLYRDLAAEIWSPDRLSSPSSMNTSDSLVPAATRSAAH